MEVVGSTFELAIEWLKIGAIIAEALIAVDVAKVIAVPRSAQSDYILVK